MSHVLTNGYVHNMLCDDNNFPTKISQIETTAYTGTKQNII